MSECLSTDVIAGERDCDCLKYMARVNRDSVGGVADMHGIGFSCGHAPVTTSRHTHRSWGVVIIDVCAIDMKSHISTLNALQHEMQDVAQLRELERRQQGGKTPSKKQFQK